MNERTDYTRRIMAKFAEKARRKDRGFIRRPEWVEGKNVFRLFPVKHVVNEWDVWRGDLGFSRDDVGKVVDLLVVPVTRYWRENMPVNGLSRDYNCPLFRAWCELDRAERQQRSRERPQDLFCVNVLNMRAVSGGVEPVFFVRSEWLGEFSQGGEQVTYGIYNLYAGYRPEGQKESEDGEELVSPGASGLAAFNGFGPDILGPKGQDIVVFKKEGTIGGEKVLRLDKSIKGGPVQVVPKKSAKGEILCVEVPDRLAQTAQDLLLIPALYPGWAGDGNHLPHPDYPDLVADFVKAIETFKATKELPRPTPPASSTIVVFAEPAEAGASAEAPSVEVASGSVATAEEEPPKKTGRGRKASKLTGLAPGAKVIVRDTEEDDGVTVELTYHGTVAQVRDHGHRYEVVLVADEQPSARAKEAVAYATQAQGTNVFVFEASQVAPRE